MLSIAGELQTDGYKTFLIFDCHPDISLLAWRAHARRYFEKALGYDMERAGYMLSKMQALIENSVSCRSKIIRQ